MVLFTQGPIKILWKDLPASSVPPPLHRCRALYIASAIGQKGAAQRSALIRQGAETVPSQDAARPSYRPRDSEW